MAASSCMTESKNSFAVFGGTVRLCSCFALLLSFAGCITTVAHLLLFDLGQCVRCKQKATYRNSGAQSFAFAHSALPKAVVTTVILGTGIRKYGK